MSKTAFILPDQHYEPEGGTAGGVDPRAESVALQAIRIVKPDIFINIGDVCEFDSVSHWRYKRVKRPPLEYQLPLLERELQAGNAGMDKFDRELDRVGCSERHLTYGNHDAWLDTFIEAHPYLADKYSLDIALKIKERGYKSHQYGKFLQIGHLLFYHGSHYTGANHTKDHAMRLGKSVIYGHTHDVQVSKVQHFGGAVGAWSMGCIAKMDKPFLKGRPTNWGHAVGIVHFEDSGEFNVEVVDIFEGRAFVYGKRVEAKL